MVPDSLRRLLGSETCLSVYALDSPRVISAGTAAALPREGNLRSRNLDVVDAGSPAGAIYPAASGGSGHVDLDLVRAGSRCASAVDLGDVCAARVDDGHPLMDVVASNADVGVVQGLRGCA